MSKQSKYRIEGLTLTPDDRVVIAKWSGQHVPATGDFTLKLSIEQLQQLNNLFGVLGKIDTEID